jgi:hypothetical protein
VGGNIVGLEAGVCVVGPAGNAKRFGAIAVRPYVKHNLQFTITARLAILENANGGGQQGWTSRNEI